MTEEQWREVDERLKAIEERVAWLEKALKERLDEEREAFKGIVPGVDPCNL